MIIFNAFSFYIIVLILVLYHFYFDFLVYNLYIFILFSFIIVFSCRFACFLINCILLVIFILFFKIIIVFYVDCQCCFLLCMFQGLVFILRGLLIRIIVSRDVVKGFCSFRFIFREFVEIIDTCCLASPSNEIANCSFLALFIAIAYISITSI